MLRWLGCLWPWPLTLSNCISGIGGPIVMEWKGRESIGCPDVKHYGNESTGCCADWGTFDFEFSRSNCISGMGGSNVMERKWQESLGCPDVKHNDYVTLRQRILLPTGWLKMLAFPSTRLVAIENSWDSQSWGGKIVQFTCFSAYLSSWVFLHVMIHFRTLQFDSS